MIKIIIKGGLGNQMFQYAAAKSLALERNTDLYLDLSFIKNRIPLKDFTYRDYELDLFDIEDKSGAFFNSQILDKYFAYPTLLIQNKFLNPNYYSEGDNPYLFDPKFLDLPNGTTLEGYFNNYKYFANHEKEIKSIFDLDRFYDPKYQDIESKISSVNSVSINIRRGDYLNSKHKDVFAYLTEDYYKESIKLIESRNSDIHYFVFSYDDPEWFEETFNMDKAKYTMIGKEYAGERFKTYLRLISLCKHNIISNSTFAWWGAYLNRNNSKTVISPKKWMLKYKFDLPSDWITINNK